MTAGVPWGQGSTAQPDHSHQRAGTPLLLHSSPALQSTQRLPLHRTLPWFTALYGERIDCSSMDGWGEESYNRLGKKKIIHISLLLRSSNEMLQFTLGFRGKGKR